jgi:hypothetical protein
MGIIIQKLLLLVHFNKTEKQEEKEMKLGVGVGDTLEDSFMKDICRNDS